jgi:hypothetical protein
MVILLCELMSLSPYSMDLMVLLLPPERISQQMPAWRKDDHNQMYPPLLFFRI